MKLLIDIGNTRIKWCVETNGRLLATQTINYKQLDLSAVLQQQWFKMDAPSFLAISSVGSKQASVKIIEIAKNMWPQIQLVVAKTSAYNCSVTNAYVDAEKLGIDRWLGLIALYDHYPGNACIVDCGTAITIDFIDKRGLHQGGVISPGLQLMRQALVQGTEDLMFTEDEYAQQLATNTQSAICMGTLYAVAGLIEKLIKSYNSDGIIVLTGGDAQVLSEYLDFEVVIDSDIILKGLFLYCQQEIMK